MDQSLPHILLVMVSYLMRDDHLMHPTFLFLLIDKEICLLTQALILRRSMTFAPALDISIYILESLGNFI